MSYLVVVSDPERVCCPLCDKWVAQSAVEKALERGYFKCSGERVRLVPLYVINELVLA